MSSRSPRAEWRVLMLVSVAIVLAGCSSGFQPRRFANPEALFRASLQEFQKKHWENAQIGFERLTNDLSARDPLLAPALFYLALTHERRSEYLLASQAFLRVSDGFPDDSLAPSALLGAGRSYQKLWRKPGLDSDNGQKAISTFRVLLGTYPTAKQAEEAKSRIATLEDWFAQKDYDTGVHYMRVRKAIDPAIIYFKDVVANYPAAPTARLAWLRLHELYTKIRWKEDASEACTTMRKAYPDDAAVKVACAKDTTPAVAAPAVTKPDTFPSPSGLARPGPR